jgi:HrpA-like RNA helicase
MPPSLLNRGALEIPKMATPAQAQIYRDAIPKNFIIDYVKNNTVTSPSPGSRVFIFKSGTGSGKSTILPGALYQLRGRRVAVTQPQRITAEEIPYDVCKVDPYFKMGENIGFQTGLINKSPPTGVVYMTTGVLLMQLNIWDDEKIMRRYSTIIVDEVHKHDLATDVILRLLKLFLTKNYANPACPIVILQSATLEAEKYREYFDTVHYIAVSGVGFAITPHWPTAAVADVTQSIVDICDELTGDTLVFLPSKKSITAVKEALERSTKNRADRIIELMGETVARGEVKELLRPAEKKQFRVALATNAAETGLTLDYLSNVIDSGLVTTVTFNPVYNATVIALQVATKASAMQRRGRVGRKTAGEWYPLFTEATFDALLPANYPEIYIADSALYLLNLIIALTGIELDDQHKLTASTDFDPATLGLIHNPTSDSLCMSYEKLYQLGLIRRDWRPTVTGVLATSLKKLTLETAKMLLSYAYHAPQSLAKLIVIAAGMFVGKLGVLPADAAVRCDFVAILQTYERLQAAIARSATTSAIEAWCTKNDLNYWSWMAVIENVYDISLQFLDIGIKVDVATASMPTPIAEINAIKHAIYEGFRLQSAVWNDDEQAYRATFKNIKLTCRREWGDVGPPRTILTDKVLYVGGKFSVGEYISSLDGVVDLDAHFLY